MMERERLVRELLYQIRLGKDSCYEFKQVTFYAATKPANSVETNHDS